MLPSSTLWAAAGAGLASGLLIGAIGVGGIILVPILVELPKVEVREAVASAMASYIFAGLTGFLVYRRHHKIVLLDTAWLCAGAAPAAFLGSLALSAIDGDTIKYLLYTMMLLSSVFALLRAWQTRRKPATAPPESKPVTPIVVSPAGGGRQPPGTETSPLSPSVDKAYTAVGPGNVPRRDSNAAAAQAAPQFAPRGTDSTSLKVVVGAVVGFGSALTGTSGPVILLPILITLHWPIFASLGYAQTIQIPIAIMSTVGNILFNPGELDVTLAAVLAAALVPGVIIGAWSAKRIPADRMKPFVAILLVVCSIVLIVRLLV